MLPAEAAEERPVDLLNSLLSTLLPQMILNFESSDITLWPKS